MKGEVAKVNGQAVAQAQKTASPASTPKRGGLLQRKCACGGTAGLADGCESCQRRRLLGMQTKLVVSRPGDDFEAEADRVADGVMRMPERVTPDPSPRLQRQAITSVGSAIAGSAQTPPIVQEVLSSQGQPLDAATRSFMESRFGHDFGQVRLHTDSRADASARAVDALAYTVGHDVVFGEGRYSPSTSEGRRLLAHELTHVIQQSDSIGGLTPRANSLVQRQTTGHVLQRQKDAPKKKLIILSLKEIKGDDKREKRRAQTGQAEARVCKSVNKAPDAENCPDKLQAGTEVTFVAETVKDAWFQIENTGFKLFGPKQPAYVIAAFAKEKPAEQLAKPAAAPAKPEAAPQKPAQDSLTERVKKRLDNLPEKVKWVAPKGHPEKGRTWVAINLLITAKDFYFTEPTDREAGDAILERVKRNFSDPFLTDSNFDKNFGNLSGLARTDLRMLLLAGRGSLSTLIGKIKSGQVTPLNAGSEATWKHHQTEFIAMHEVMEVLAGDLALKDAKNIQALEVVAGGKGFTAFVDGLLKGLKSHLSDEDYKTISKKMMASGVPIIGQGVFLAGATVGIAKDVRDAFKSLIDLVTQPVQMVKNMVEVLGILLTDEEAARAMGEALGEEKSKEINKMAGENIVTFTFTLGELIGPTIVYAILWITGIGEAATAAAVERLGLTLKRFPKVVSTLEKIDKSLEKVKALMPKRKTVKAAEEAERIAKAVTEVTKGAEETGKVAKGTAKVAEDAGKIGADTGKAATAGTKAAAADAGAATDAKKVTSIDEAHRIRARKAAQAAEVPEQAAMDLASGDDLRASSGKGKGKGGKTVSGGSDEFEGPKRKVTESSGSGETNVPPERPAVEIDPRVRGNAIERQHLDSMPEYSRPKAGDFKGIDAWKGGKEAPSKVLPNGQKVRTVTKADVLQVKSVGKASRIEAEVSEGLKGLNSDVFTSPTDKSLRVINPASRTLDVIFEEGAVPDLSSEVKAIMRAQAERAGNELVEIRWFRFSGGRKVRITL